MRRQRVTAASMLAMSPGAERIFGSIASSSSSSGPVRRIDPRLSGRIIPAISEKAFSGPSIHSS